ncbi:MAG: hypothetical protein ACOY0T_19955 [Myxococcota bacterium]
MSDAKAREIQRWSSGVHPDAELCYENESAVLYFHPRVRIVHHQLRGFIRGEQFRTLLEEGLKLLQSRRASKWLSDDRLNAPVTPADERWIKTDWTPRALAAGWKYWAIVLPENVLGQMNMRRWIEAHGQLGVTAQSFSEPEAARRWLEER